MVRERPSPSKKPSAAGASLSIILVDGARVRQRIKRAYEKVSRELVKAREELDRFQNEDSPSYSRWVNLQFGALLTELRETSRRIRDLKQLFREIDTEMFYHDVSEAQAYARVMHRRENQETEASADEGAHTSGGQAGADNESRSSRSHGGFEDAGPDFDPFSSNGKAKAPHRGRNSAATLTRLKELYRALARRLHPDAQKEMTPQKREWWHQVQAAYEAGDIEKLEVILSLCEIEDAGNTAQTSLSVLQRITTQLRKSLRQIRMQLTALRLEPAWNFTGRSDISDLDAAMRRQLKHDLALMKEQLQSMELEKAAFSAPSRRRHSSRTRRQPISDPFEYFF